MTTTETRSTQPGTKPATNGTAKRTRTRKVLDAKAAGIKDQRDPRRAARGRSGEGAAHREDAERSGAAMTAAERHRVHAAIDGLLLAREMGFAIVPDGVECLRQKYKSVDAKHPLPVRGA